MVPWWVPLGPRSWAWRSMTGKAGNDSVEIECPFTGRAFKDPVAQDPHHNLSLPGWVRLRQTLTQADKEHFP